MALLAEIVQTFILADFCYYYVKRVRKAGRGGPNDKPCMMWNCDPVSAAVPAKPTAEQLDTNVSLSLSSHYATKSRKTVAKRTAMSTRVGLALI
ncbi:hypothetical protein Syun_006264 [Stephania yunnanensis]|uniref:Uncharacterized protein n=1 Tax=Stephania yunnanensis TaxID=152371 RepID=A0AAP0PXE1_9MAGN